MISPHKKKCISFDCNLKKAGVILQRNKDSSTLYSIFELSAYCGYAGCLIYIFGYQLVNQTLRTN